MHFPFGPVGGPYSPFSSWRIRCWGMSKSSHPVFKFLVLLVKMWSGDLTSETIYCYSINQQRSWFVFRPSWPAGNTWSRVHSLAPALSEAPLGPRRTPPLMPKLCAKAAVQCAAGKHCPSHQCRLHLLLLFPLILSISPMEKWHWFTKAQLLLP